jgi:mRNA-degrading endonuclease toxin of MazEF toxin-antitoxin module
MEATTETTPATESTESAAAASTTDAKPIAPAIPAPSTEATTHVLVENDSVASIHNLTDQLEKEGAEVLAAELIKLIRHIFPRLG